jgi:hypothetical protein
VAVLVGLVAVLLMLEQVVLAILRHLHRPKVLMVVMAAPELILAVVVAELLRLALLVALAPQQVMVEMAWLHHFQEAL